MELESRTAAALVHAATPELAARGSETRFRLDALFVLNRAAGAGTNATATANPAVELIVSAAHRSRPARHGPPPAVPRTVVLVVQASRQLTLPTAASHAERNASRPSYLEKIVLLEWFDTHDGTVLALATLVLVMVTGWLAWTTRALARESHTTLQAAARATLQARMDRISEICINQPTLFPMLDDETATGEEEDARFHLANMFLGVLEEAHTQHAIEGSMSDEDWGAWVATAEVFLPRVFMVRYWARVNRTFEPAFQRFVNEQIAAGTAP